jgi:hypothetical protein
MDTTTAAAAEDTTTTAPETTEAPEETTTEAPAEETTTAPADEVPDATIAPGLASGATAPLDAEGFKAVTSLCCPVEVEAFFNRLLDDLGYDVCSKTHVQGLMHWFSCVPNMDFQYMLDVINNGNPCKYWSLKGVACPALSPECEGHWCR